MSDNVGRRPTGDGPYWYEGREYPFGPLSPDNVIVSEPVLVALFGPNDGSADVLRFGSSMPRPLSDYPGTFTPLTRPVADVSQLSDGYHTFAELYEHRHTLFAALMYAYAPLAFKTRRNQEGEEWPGWFIAGLNTAMGQLSYHMPDEWWDRLPDIRELEYNQKYDGHTSADVLQRISLLQDFYQHPDPNPWPTPPAGAHGET